MAEGRFKTVLPRGDATEVPVAGAVVAESCFESVLPRDPATEAPVAGVIVSGLGKNTGKGPIRHLSDTRGGPRGPCGQGDRG